MNKGLKILLFHIEGAGLVIIFGVMMIMAEELPRGIILALSTGFSLIAAVFAIRLILSKVKA